MTSSAPYLDFAVVQADDDLQELTVSAASHRFAGQVSLYASPDELRDIADRLRPFLSGRGGRREFLLGQEDFVGYGTVRLSLNRKEFADNVLVEVALRANPSEPHAPAESCVLRFPASVAELERFEADLRRVAQRLGSRAVIGP